VETTKSVKVYALQSPESKILFRLEDKAEEAALISYVYTLTGPRRPQPSVEPEKTVYKNLRPWKKVPVPRYVVVAESQDLIGSLVVAWDGKKSLQGDAPWGRPVIGTIADKAEDCYTINANIEGIAAAVQLEEDRRQKEIIKAQKEAAQAPAPPPEPVVVIEPPVQEPEPVMVSGTPYKDEPQEPYTGDPFTVSADGHFVGDDGFVVPRNFDEFYERYPKYIMNWVKKRLNRFQVDEDVEDWSQDLIIHMKFLPQGSKHRQPGANGREVGCQDVIETFNPYQQYGASERRFRYYVNFCLANKFNTVQSKRQKNPVCRPGNLAFGAAADIDEVHGQGDEFIHSNSSHLTALAERKEKQHDDRLYTNQFKRFVKKEDPTVYPAIEALEATGPMGEAAAYMGVSEQEFTRLRARLKQLGECFLQKSVVPKQRKPYKKRTAASQS